MKKLTLFLFLSLIISGTWQNINSGDPTPMNIELLSSSIDNTKLKFTMDGFHLIKSNETAFDSSDESKWNLILSETGLNSSTGYRLWLIRDYLLKNEDSDFMLTYGDGVADININELIQFHKKSGKLGTITAVHNQSRFGNLVIENGICKDFKEKSTSKDSWINGGFCIFNKKALYIYIREMTDVETPVITKVTKSLKKLYKQLKTKNLSNTFKNFPISLSNTRSKTF